MVPPRNPVSGAKRATVAPMMIQPTPRVRSWSVGEEACPLAVVVAGRGGMSAIAVHFCVLSVGVGVACGEHARSAGLIRVLPPVVLLRVVLRRVRMRGFSGLVQPLGHLVEEGPDDVHR